MNPERWQRIKGIVAEALEREPSGRAMFVKNSCGADTELYREVESILARSGEKMERFAEGLDETRRTEEAISRAGERLGAYEIVGEIGRGGMGAVYLARRADETFEKQVAIKLLKRGTDTEEVLRRFRAERQILARLEHTNIARLIDAGTTADGLPYFIMEYVEGAPITDYCEEQKLSIRQRVELFLKVCAAVDFAHRNLVVHRDLKPRNIFITAEGEPKLLDFGIAKLLALDGEFTQTVLDQQRLTPAYASPEQVRGEPVTTTTDVYSLGALLYELLAGRPPHRFSTPHPSPTDLFRIIVEEEPPRPSAAAASGEVARELHGDLDTILQTALRKEPERRYSGVTAFADDLRRYLEHRPVRARPPTFGYRASRFISRNKVALAVATIIVVGLVVGVTAYVIEARRAAFHAQREAAHFRDLRKLANLFIFKYQDGIALLPGSTELRKQLVQDALEYLNNLVRAEADDSTLLREVAAAYKRIGDVQGGVLTSATTRGTVSSSNLGETAGAFDSYRKALALREKLARDEPGNNEIQRELAETYSDLGGLSVTRGKPIEAAQYYRKQINVLEQLLAADPPNKTVSADLRTAYWGLANILGIQPSNLGDIAGALEAMRKGLAIAESLAAQEPQNAAYRQQLAVGYGDTGRLLFNDGKFAEALDYYRKALAIGETLVKENPTTPLHRRELAVQHRNVGGALLQIGNKVEALEHFRQAVALFEQLIREDPNDARTRRSSAYGYRDLGEALAANGDRAEAEKNFETALRIFEELAAKDPKNAILVSQQALTHLKISRFFSEGDDVPRALGSAERAVQLGEMLVASTPNDVTAAKNLAESRAQLAKCRELVRKR